jgi:diaminopimelate decarboxylase
MICDNLSVNEQGHLTLGSVDTVDMAKKYGTPLYLYDENRISERCRVYVNAMRSAV